MVYQVGAATMQVEFRGPKMGRWQGFLTSWDASLLHTLAHAEYWTACRIDEPVTSALLFRQYDRNDGMCWR